MSTQYDDYLVEFQSVKQLEQFAIFLIVLQLDVVLLQTVQGQFRVVVDVHLHWLSRSPPTPSNIMAPITPTILITDGRVKIKSFSSQWLKDGSDSHLLGPTPDADA